MFKSRYLHEFLFDTSLIIMNTLTFEYQTLSDKNSKKWLASKFDSIDCADHLLARKMLIRNKNEDEALLDLCIKNFGKSNNTPHHIFYISDACNLKCEYCFQNNISKSDRLNKNMYSLVDSFIRAISTNSLFATNDKKNITIFGGEPLLPSNQGLLSYLFERLRDIDLAGSGVEIVSNGVLIHHFTDFFEKNGDLVKIIRVTLNGPEDIHNKVRVQKDGKGTYSQILDNIKLINRISGNTSVIINILLDKGNVSHIDRLLNELEATPILNENVTFEFGRIQFRINPKKHGYEELPYTDYYNEILHIKRNNMNVKNHHLSGSEAAMIGQIYNFWESNDIILPQLNGCRAFRFNRLCFYTDGNIYPCTEVAGLSDFSIAQYEPDFLISKQQYDQWYDFDIEKYPSCMGCKYIGMCNGGCPVTNYFMNGTFEKPYCIDYETSLNNFLRPYFEKANPYVN